MYPVTYAMQNHFRWILLFKILTISFTSFPGKRQSQHFKGAFKAKTTTL